MFLVSKNIQQRGETISHFFRVVNTFRSLFLKKDEIFSYFLNKPFKNKGLMFKNIFNFFSKYLVFYGSCQDMGVG